MTSERSQFLHFPAYSRRFDSRSRSSTLGTGACTSIVTPILDLVRVMSIDTSTAVQLYSCTAAVGKLEAVEPCLACTVQLCSTVQAHCSISLGKLVSLQLCLFLFNSVFHACVYLFYLIQFFMHARWKTRMCILDLHRLQLYSALWYSTVDSIDSRASQR